MIEVTNELIFEVLKQLQHGQVLMREDIHEVKGRMTSIEHHLVQVHKEMALIHGDLANHSSRMDRIEHRLERIEKRLELQ